MYVWQNGQSLVGCQHFVWSKLSQTFSISNMLTCTSHTALDIFCLIVVTLLPARCKHIFCHSSFRFILTLYWWQPITQSECQTQGTFLISDPTPNLDSSQDYMLMDHCDEVAKTKQMFGLQMCITECGQCTFIWSSQTTSHLLWLDLILMDVMNLLKTENSRKF